MFTKIAQKTIKELECSSTISNEELQKTTFEVLKVKNCPSVDEFLLYITSSKFHSHFHHAKCAFVIIAECEDDPDVRELTQEELKEISDCYRAKKLMVVSIEGKTNETKSYIYYKQLHECEFKTLGQSNDESQTQTTSESPPKSFEQNFNFSSFLLNLNAQNFGIFDGKLLDTKIDTSTCYNGKRLIDYAVESNKTLSVRFLQLFNFDLKRTNENGERPLEIAAKLPTMDAFVALLKFKFEFWNDELCKCDYNLLHLRNKNGLTLLMLAALSGNNGVVSLLVKIGVDKNHEVHGETASSLAWKNKKFEAFLILLKFDARYPKSFKNELEERWETVPKEVKKFVSTIEAFHLMVSKNETQEYEKILQTYPNVFHFYNTQNQSAAMTALKSSESNAWTYEDLIKKGIYVGFHEKLDSIIDDSQQIQNPKQLCGRNLITLMSKSYVGCSTSYEEKKKKVQHILRCYNLLHQIESIRPILNIVVSFPIKMIFDFSRLSVQHLHPEASDYNSGK